MADPELTLTAPAGIEDATPLRSHVTLVLCTVLHAFTHAYGTLLVPLYLLMVADLRLPGVWAASLIVTVYGFVYCAGSYVGGVLADRTNRKTLLGIGLIGNAAAVLLMGVTRQYELLVVLAVVAGLSGTLFHPCANALVPAHYPRSPGMAIGLLGIGAGLGFFVGPQYAGWRAASDAWHWWAWAGLHVPGWQRPLVEMGAFGLVVGVVFLAVAREARDRDKAALTDRDYDDIAPGGAAMPAHGVPESAHPPLGRALSRKVVAIALALACRDFSGIASLTLTSVYLQKARGLDARQAGFILGAMMLITVVINPVSVWLSPGKRRLPALAAVLIAGGAIIATAPFWPVRLVLPVLCAFQACHLGSYAISDAAIMERVDPNVRGRVVGLFLTVAGTIASTSPWVMGAWTDALGSRASEPTAYAGPFGLVGFLIALASVCTLVIARLGKAPEGRHIQPMSETMPATVGPVG